MPSLVFLGTSAGCPVKGRNVTSHGLRLDDGKIFLLDCGEGTQHQFLKCADLKAGKVEVILITHMHGDHVFGLNGLLASLSLYGRDQPVKVIGPPGIKEYIESNNRLSATYITYPLEIKELEEGKITKLGTLHGLEVVAYPLKHKVTSFGYILSEPEKRGKLDAKKAKELGASPKDMGLLSNGQDVTLPDGRVIKSADVIGETRKGRKIVLLGDTSNSDSLAEDAANCDVIVHESTYEASFEAKAIEGGHSTSKMAGQFAKKIHAKKLILTHFSSRYTSKGQSDEKSEGPFVDQLVDEAKHECPETEVLAAEDFKKFEL